MNLKEYIRSIFKRPCSTVIPAQDSVKLVDEGFLASWDPFAGKQIRKTITAARLGYIDEQTAAKYLDSLNDTVKRSWNDQTLLPEQLEPLQASYKYDKITDYGLSLFCGLIAGKSLPLISHIGIGDGVGETYDYQDTLFAERVRLALADTGYSNSQGRTLRFFNTYDIMMASATFTELGLFNNPHIGVGPLIARSVFSPGVEHVSGFNYITASYLINTLSA